MKKVISLILAIMMVATLAVNCFAAEGSLADKGKGTYDLSDVTVKYVAGADGADVYFVDIAWEDLTFTYTADARTWNPATHKWDDIATTGKWDKTTADVTVTNDSSVGVTATVAVVDKVEDKGVTVTVDNAELTLAKPEADVAAVPGVATVKVAGDLNDRAATAGIVVGKVQVTIA